MHTILRNHVESVRELFQNFKGRGVLGNFFHLKQMINRFFFYIFFIKLNCCVLFGDVDISFVWFWITGCGLAWRMQLYVWISRQCSEGRAGGVRYGWGHEPFDNIVLFIVTNTCLLWKFCKRSLLRLVNKNILTSKLNLPTFTVKLNLAHGCFSLLNYYHRYSVQQLTNVRCTSYGNVDRSK